MLLSLCKSVSLVNSEVCEMCSGPGTRTLAYLLRKMQVQWCIQSLACARTQRKQKSHCWDCHRSTRAVAGSKAPFLGMKEDFGLV